MLNKSLRFVGLAVVIGLVAGMQIQAVAQSASRQLVVSREAKLGGKVLAQGKYSISYDESKDGDLVVSKNGQEVAKVAYKLVDLGKDASNSAVVFSASEDGSLQIRRIEIKGSKTALQL
jgi:hypothetical protein